MQLAGVSVREEDVLEIAFALRNAGFEDLATRLQDAVRLETKVLSLTVTEREMILRGLDDPPTAALAELRGVLVPGARVAGARGACLARLSPTYGGDKPSPPRRVPTNRLS